MEKEAYSRRGIPLKRCEIIILPLTYDIVIKMIRKQPFGGTGHPSTSIIFGGAAIGRVTQEVADDVLGMLLRYGVNHIDTASSYGESELRIGQWMQDHRDDFFLATKTGERTYRGANAGIHRSLERLQVESLDLIQLHNLTRPDDWDVAMGEEGALKAAIEAKETGLARFIGVTGHGLMAAAMHLRSLERYPFDSVLLPWNYILFKESRYNQDFKALLEVCKDRNVAFQTIKSITKGSWADKTRTRSTWYEPLQGPADIDRAVSWILGQGYLFLNSASDIELLSMVLDSASRFTEQPSEEEMDLMVEKSSMSRLFVS
jgi:aryl-alcohol dehydrogenase-like predicted oxidoreductase